MFATTEALAFPRSAELARSFKKTCFFEDGGVLFLRFYGAVVCDVLELPPIIFLSHPLSVAMAQIYAIAGI